MEWENEFKKHLLKILREFDPDVEVQDVHIIGIGFPDIDDLSTFSVPDLGRLYAFSLMREDYEQANAVKEEFDKRGCKVNLDIDDKTKTGILDISVAPEKSVEHIEINMKVLKDGLSIDWDKEDI